MYHRIVFPMRNILLLLWDCCTGPIQTARLGGKISVIFGNQVSYRLRDCKSDEEYLTTLVWQNSGRPNDLISRTFFSELKKLWWIKWLSTVLGVAISLPPSHRASDPARIVCTISGVALSFISRVTSINFWRVLLCSFHIRYSCIDNSDWLWFSWSM